MDWRADKLTYLHFGQGSLPLRGLPGTSPFGNVSLWWKAGANNVNYSLGHVARR